ncbi:Wadjet anti-phage system protein JetD domain-containing protein [Pseudomonas knackmussii]|uniref:Wadjet anti-phage system protein JetD domain-containing protein n=1 Tax=Pseudomonas knackmussii TaxID=65741 RepID=UPI003F4A483C
MSLVETTLGHLLERAERARLSGSTRAIRESFKSLASPYWQLNLDERDRLHERMRAAASAGAIKLEWAKLGGDDRPLEAVVLLDLDKLANHLRRPTASTTLAQATALLAPWSQHERVQELLVYWAQLKQARLLGPTSASDFVDALRVLDVMREATEDRIVRQLSTELFGSSKRLEALSKHLDLLTSEALNAPARHWSEVFSAIGLIKEPQPFLVAGMGKLQLNNQDDCPILRPYLGVANTVVEGYVGTPAWLLTIENLTTFHQAARELSKNPSGVVLYTAGMPSPSWGKAYFHILTALPKGTPVYHWGDHDEGGFRIAAQLAQFASRTGHPLRPWSMDASLWQNVGHSAKAEQHRAMVRNAVRAGWLQLADQIAPVLFEQEGQPLRLPA